MTVRTRFAPSPTGYLHVGGVRTALFSWLYAKRHRGEFILRIEDTDQERSTQESVRAILDGMAWLGMDYDEGPFYQTKRYDRYNHVVQQLLNEGKAYRCECSKERLEALRESQIAAKEKPRYDGHCRNKNLPASDAPFVIRFKNPDQGTVSFHDQVYGEIHVANSELDDLILIRSDGHPTYNFAVVIDDLDMNITHVIRGDDHINNTPRQINLFQALNAPIPVFAHLPMILGEDGKRLSKRHGAVGVLQFKELGILPHALLNYLVRLGWSHGDQEIFSIDEMIASFDLKNVSRGVSSFNYEKLYWLNQHYQKNDPVEDVAEALHWHFEKEGIKLDKGPSLTDLVPIQAERCKTLAEICQMSTYFYTDSIEYDEAAVKKHLRPVVLEPLTALYERLNAVELWEKEHLQECINDISAQFDINMGKIAQPLRVAVTGSGMSPPIDMTLMLLGKEKVLTRLAYALEQLKIRSGAQL
ncbi:glutamate--tRNA ligase [Legionella longbeachae]|uniref:Glutamate--tRNA ligase n=1 Tax=Legionella longbeachae serogroup 1 (strain NSW150) TaxID=661367 RepID=D3HRR6_LEGLN|nr:glutamate--tRNA ligase [Legionella longbeachae]VEE02099.1 glutamyl-tRNA synthetase, catalytic subunit [Legionella oakridgensis]HBD7396655.1 glutamate--tRNA ligase [Legionella pneumophila]ARB91599.1 glutamate--tRNA ligase [Legionella longbeachae]EEZ95286.1 glutamyl-tRNA synthetase [Legionella longbeachae D-4968]QEY51203.1 glutamate--tRNA ligase [Legionella longbeachae]